MAQHDHAPRRRRWSRRLLSRWGRLARKELRETLRDRRTIVTLLLMPVLVYPLLSIIFQRFLLSSMPGEGVIAYRIGFVDNQQGAYLLELLQQGERLAGGNPHRWGVRTPEQDEAARQDGYRIELMVTEGDAAGLEAQVADFSLDLGMRLVDVPAENHDKAAGGRPPQVQLIFRPDAPTSEKVRQLVEVPLEALNRASLRSRLQAAGVSSELPAETKLVAVQYESGNEMSVAGILPLILVLMTITGAVYPAIDLTAGERERGTLEVLISAPVPRFQLLLAKYSAVLTVAVLTAGVNLGAMSLTVLATGLGPVLLGESGMSGAFLLRIFAVMLLFAALFSAVLLAITVFARSFKEAQVYLIPLMLASIAPGLLTLTPGVQLSGPTTVIPLVNMVLLARDVFGPGVDPLAALVVLISSLFYIAAALGLAARAFGTDAVVLGERSRISDLFRRPAEPRSVPTVAGALLCLALIFPVHYLLSHLLSASEAGFRWRLLGSGLMTALLFAVFPILAAGRERVAIRSGFRLTSAKPLAYVGAVLLGLSLWPLAFELVQYGKQIGLTIPEGTVAGAEQLITNLLENTSLPLLLLVFAVAPGLCEEFFFRGYLFSALRSTSTSWQTIGVTALLFGLFHVILASALAIERFLPSTALGLVIGWVCWRTGSVFPGMLLHVVHNGFLNTLMYKKDRLVQMDLLTQKQEHLPIGLVAVSCMGVLLGAGLVSLASRRRDPGPTEKQQPESVAVEASEEISPSADVST